MRIGILKNECIKNYWEKGREKNVFSHFTHAPAFLTAELHVQTHG